MEWYLGNWESCRERRKWRLIRRGRFDQPYLYLVGPYAMTRLMNRVFPWFHMNMDDSRHRTHCLVGQTHKQQEFLWVCPCLCLASFATEAKGMTKPLRWIDATWPAKPKAEICLVAPDLLVSLALSPLSRPLLLPLFPFLLCCLLSSSLSSLLLFVEELLSYLSYSLLK